MVVILSVMKERQSQLVSVMQLTAVIEQTGQSVPAMRLVNVVAIVREITEIAVAEIIATTVEIERIDTRVETVDLREVRGVLAEMADLIDMDLSLSERDVSREIVLGHQMNQDLSPLKAAQKVVVVVGAMIEAEVQVENPLDLIDSVSLTDRRDVDLEVAVIVTAPTLDVMIESVLSNQERVHQSQVAVADIVVAVHQVVHLLEDVLSRRDLMVVQEALLLEEDLPLLAEEKTNLH